MVNITRRKLSRLIMLGAAPALLGQDKETPEEKIDQGRLRLDAPVSPRRKEGVQKALRKMEAEVATLRKYQINRNTPPALILGAFDEPDTLALKGDRNAG